MIMMIITRLTTWISLHGPDDYHLIDIVDLSMIMMIITRLTTLISFHDHDEYHQIYNMDLSP